MTTETGIRKHAFILYSTDEKVGTLQDERNYKKFFMSQRGGCWRYGEEITCVSAGKSRDFIMSELKRVTEGGLDYFIFVYSGHGFMEKGSTDTYLWLDSQEEISVSDLLEMFREAAPRQLSIFDCCRSLPEEKPERAGMSKVASAVQESTIRMFYDWAVMAASHGQYEVYSCSPLECSAGGKTVGGFFTYALMSVTDSLVDVAEDLAPSLKTHRFDVGHVFPLVQRMVSAYTQIGLLNQVPDVTIPATGCNLPWAMIPRRAGMTVRQLVNWANRGLALSHIPLPFPSPPRQLSAFLPSLAAVAASKVTEKIVVQMGMI